MQATTSYDNANNLINTGVTNANATAQTAMRNANATLQTSLINTGVGAVGGGIGALLGDGGLGGVVNSLAGAGQSALSAMTVNDNAQASNATTLQNSLRSATAQQQNAGRDYNTALRSNQGDYQNAIAGINATVQDAALTPPSTVGQSGGQGFNWKNGLVCITVTYKTLAGASLNAVADYFRRYGYSVRRFLSLGSVRHMLCMSKFAYWKAIGASLTCANANESERETMRGILEKGVTLWDAPESIGNTAATDNAARDGYSY